jgi:hypothetical protein
MFKRNQRKMNTLFKNRKSKGVEKKHLLFFFLLLVASTVFGTQIDIPGTGRGVTFGDHELNWHFYGKWSIPFDEEEPTLPDETKRIGTTDLCISSGDYEIKNDLSHLPLHSGGATGFFSYPFTVIQPGTYSVACYLGAASHTIQIAKYTGVYDREVIAFNNEANSPCKLYDLSAALTPGEYEIRIPVTLSSAMTAYAFVSSASITFNPCVPAVSITQPSTSVITRNSGETINIPIVASVSSALSWTTAGNPNTNVSGTESGTTTPIVRTITNSTSTVQTLIYSITPTSTTGGCIGTTKTITVIINPPCVIGCDQIACTDCIGSFAPDVGQTYVITAWVQQANSTQEMTYTGPALGLTFTGGGTQGPFYASGAIIDGWQRIDATFTVPGGASEVFVKLMNTGSNEAYFDDLRIQPLKASLKSFVYDPVSMRLMAELDENNYATFYEYDEEGALIRVKKETERGIKTIKETGNNIRKIQR